MNQLEQQANQAASLTLVTNAIITWNTVYIAEAVRQLKSEGHQISDEEVSHISPCRFDHINKYGSYEFKPQKGLSRSCLRPLRQG